MCHPAAVRTLSSPRPDEAAAPSAFIDAREILRIDEGGLTVQCTVKTAGRKNADTRRTRRGLRGACDS
jgi:hypothetical protein